MIGQTMMDGDEKNVIACLACPNTDSGCTYNPQWKSMNGGEASCPQQNLTQTCAADVGHCGCTTQKVCQRHGCVEECVANSCCWPTSPIGPSPNGASQFLSSNIATGSNPQATNDPTDGMTASGGAGTEVVCAGGTWMCIPVTASAWAEDNNLGYAYVYQLSASAGAASPCHSY
jgi:hypothetical protein